VKKDEKLYLRLNYSLAAENAVDAEK